MCYWEFSTGESCAFEPSGDGTLVPKDKKAFMNHGIWEKVGFDCLIYGGNGGIHCDVPKPTYKTLVSGIPGNMEGSSPAIVIIPKTPRLDDNGNLRGWDQRCQVCRDNDNKKAK